MPIHILLNYRWVILPDVANTQTRQVPYTFPLHQRMGLVSTSSYLTWKRLSHHNWLFHFAQIKRKTKMHSSRMHTVRSSSRLLGGLCSRGGLCSSGGAWSWGGSLLPGGCLVPGVSAPGGGGVCRVPTRPGKPGKMRVHLENLEI